MNGLHDLLASGQIFLLIAGIQTFELVGLGAYHRLTGRGPAPRRFVPALCAGLGLSLAALLAAVAAGPMAVGAALCVSLCAHLFDLASLRDREPAPAPAVGVRSASFVQTRHAVLKEFES